jgi:hypothetical protein
MMDAALDKAQGGNDELNFAFWILRFSFLNLYYDRRSFYE